MYVGYIHSFSILYDDIIAPTGVWKHRVTCSSFGVQTDMKLTALYI